MDSRRKAARKPADADPFFVSPDDAPSKREVMRAALRLFAREGLEATSVRDIAAESGYTNPALFKYFATKEELARWLFERCYRWLGSEIDASIADGEPFERNLESVLTRYARIVDEAPEAVLYVQDNLRRFWPELSSSLRRHSIIALFRRFLQRGIQEGRVTTEVNITLLAMALIGVLSQFARAAFFGELSGPAVEQVGALRVLAARMVQR